MSWRSRRGEPCGGVWGRPARLCNVALAAVGDVAGKRATPQPDGTENARVLVLLACVLGLARPAAEPLRIGLLHTLSPAPLYIAMERGYFRDEGLDASFRFFEAAQPIAAAAVSGDIDVGITALTGGFFSLAGRGTLKVIGGGLHEQKGYEGTAVLVVEEGV